jgi:hypothetical protein
MDYPVIEKWDPTFDRRSHTHAVETPQERCKKVSEITEQGPQDSPIGWI